MGGGPPAGKVADLMGTRSSRRSAWRRPARVVVVAFAVATLGGAGRLMLPVSAAGEPAAFVTALFVMALFTATDAIYGGLASVDTGTYWSAFGELPPDVRCHLSRGSGCRWPGVPHVQRHEVHIAVPVILR
jgi:hypothetical protein